MTIHDKTLDRLQYLQSLYHRGYRSEVIDRSLDKIIALETAAARREFADLQGRLLAFEGGYHMSSQDFYRRFREGELGDTIDFVEWSAFYEMQESVRERLQRLESALV